ncbi:MAG: hypothetical protein EXR98_10405 [Gemmataceae bacterium]|nr:hypothetical protein [Gemmataceae bacterium]
MTPRIFLLACSVGSILAFSLTAAAGKQTKADVTAFRTYLEKQHPGKRWQTGPTALASAEIRKAYGDRRFYFVFSSPPLPPGANIQELIDAYRRKLVEFQKTAISLSVAFNDKGEIVPLTKPQDFNIGLMKVQSEDDARTAATAVLAIHGSDRVSPGAVSAREVMVTKTAKGWTCTVERRNAFAGTALFDADGKCMSVSKTYAGPVPP